ncbi:cell growth-regulating nucleolar protein [Angomonas deanei]|nr:cell growth-regulating nucleolar protein [Angomonas deanei]|eukprot:EPY18907.1 cell growth-regulating nucleolar protein [Angomonas deanei]
MPLPQSSGSAIRAVSTLRHAAAQQHQHTANLVNSTDKLAGTVTHGVTPLVDYTTGLKLPSATDEFALTAMNHSTTSYNNNNSNSNNNSNMTNGETTTAARLSGWPITTNYFTEREGVIRSPLRACLNSAMGTIHFQVRFAAKTRMSSYHGNIASIRKILRKLKKQEEEDAIKLEEMRQLKQEQLEEQQRSKSQSPMDVPEQDTTTPSEASTTKRKAKSNAGKKSTMEEGRSTMASSFATNVMSPSQYREVFTLPVPEIVAYLQSVGCAPHEGSYTVQEIDTQSFYLLPVEDHEKAAQILKNDAKKAKTHLEEFIVPKAEKEKERLEKECGKRKGKELTRAKADLDEMTELLEEVTHEASALATLATKANQEASRRSRDCVLRQARIKDLEKQLALLLEKESAELDNNHNHNEGAFSSDVKTSKVQLWFMSPFTAGVNQLRVAEGGPDSNNLLTLEAVFSNDEGTLYEREVSVPGDFEGRAVLLVDDHEVATWFVERRH